MNRCDAISDFRDRYYLRLNQRRFEHLASLGLPLRERSVIEFGAGIGDHTPYFLDRGCRVKVTDGRDENLAVARSRHPRNERVSTMLIDVDDPPPADRIGRHEIAYCFGLLYHVRNPARAIQLLAEVCDSNEGIALLETVVAYGDDDALYDAPSQPTRAWGSLTGSGCLPTRRWIANRLGDHFDFVAMTRRQPCHEEFPVSWSGETTRRVHGRSIGRAVWVAARRKLDNPGLGAPVEQEQSR